MSIKPQSSPANQANSGTDTGSDGGVAPGAAFLGGIDPAAAAFISSAAGLVSAPQPTFPTLSVVSATSTSSSVSTAATVATTSTASTTVHAASTPSWIGTLSTASIAADMAAADVGGTVSYAGLAKVFTDLETSLASSKTALTAAEFNDLKTIAANLNNGMSTSGYLTTITQALVDGNAANANWTGGGTSATTLGNLAAGSSATQLNELIGKWFMGTDLPSSAVSMDGSNFTVSYSASASPLFAASGPSMSDINQGYLGDCYLLSSLAEVAHQNSGDISSMFTVNGNGTYGVRFYVDGAAEYVTVNSSLANGGSIFNSGTDIWASLAEKAYAQLQTAGAVTGNSYSGNTWTAIGNGGAPEMALEEITGATAITDFDAGSGSWAKVVYNSSFGVTGYTTGNSTATVLSTLEADLSKGDDVVLTSWTNATDSSGRTTLVASHAMSIYGYDTSTGMLEIRNPWGSESGQYWDTTFEVSLSTLLSDGDTITADNIGQGTTPSPSAPTLTTQTAAQTWKRGQAVSFKLASNTFTDPQGSALTYTATQSNGAALPSWLSFNAQTGTFTGTVPGAAAGLTIKVTATDGYGLSASETFSVSTPAPTAPVINAQTATQTWKLGQAVNYTLASNTFTDPQGEALTYSATLSSGAALPSWLSFNAATGKFTGTVPNTAAGLSIKVTATDAGGASTSETFSVLTPASAPVLTTQTSAQMWKLGQAVNFTLASNTFTDPQGEALTYSAIQSNGAALPSWLSFNASTGQFTGTVPNTATGLSIKVTAKDSSGLSASEIFSVSTPAVAPTLTAQTATVTLKTGQTINFGLSSSTFADPQGEKLSFTATQSNGAALPGWLKFNGATDTFTGTAPTTATSLTIKVTGTDSSGLSVSETFGLSASAAAALMTQAIASTVGGSSSSSTLTHTASSTPTTLSSPLH